MNDDLEKQEEELKKENLPKKIQKKSGRSVFKLQELIKEKSQKKSKNEDEKIE